jgi:predicted XRE-type DNA-binding protein
MPQRRPWTVEVYESEQGERPALRFLQGLEGRNESEAIALVKLLQERGNTLRRPQSGALGEEQAGEGAVSKKTAVMQWIDDRLKADPRLAREVDQILGEMRLAQDLAALREKRKLTQSQVAKLIGTSQPYVAKLESGRVKNLGVATLVKCARALGGTVTVQIRSHAHPMVARRRRLESTGSLRPKKR